MAVTQRRLTVTAGSSFILQVRILVVTLVISLTTRGQDYSVASCNSKIPGSNIPMCHCDAACRIYHDCCFGYRNNDGNLSQEDISKIVDLKESSTCENIPGQRYHFYMVAPSTAASSRYRKYLSACKKLKANYADDFLPIYDSVIDSHFKNVYCLGIYKQSLADNDMNATLFWTPELNFDCYTNINATSYGFLLRQLFYNKVCTFNLVPPHGSRPRLCFKQNLKGCPMEEKCLSYQSPVVNSDGDVLRNRHCAACINPREEYTDLAVKEVQHDDETILTLTPLHEKTTDQNDINCSSVKVDSRVCCGDGLPVGLRFLHDCIKPVSKARGLLHDLETNIGRRLYKDPDGQKTRTILSRYVNMTEDMHAKGTMKYATNPCLNYVHVSIYTTVNIDYERFLRMASILKDVITVYTDSVEADIRNFTIPVEKHCVFVNPNTKVGAEAKVSPIDVVKLIIFISISCGIVLLFSCISIFKNLVSRLRRAPRTNTE